MFKEQSEQQWLSMCVSVLSRVRLFVTPWTVARQAPVSMEFSRQEYWITLPFPPPEDFPDSGVKPMSLVSLALAGRVFTTLPPFIKRVSNVNEMADGGLPPNM